MTTISRNGVLSDFVSDLRTVRQNLFKNFSKRTEIVWFQGPRFLGGLGHIQKTSLCRGQKSRTPSCCIMTYKALCHTAISNNRYLAIKNIPVSPQPSYSPDLSPCDVFHFPRLKIHLKWRCFGILEYIQTSVTDVLKAIPVSQLHAKLLWRR